MERVKEVGRAVKVQNMAGKEATRTRQEHVHACDMIPLSPTPHASVPRTGFGTGMASGPHVRAAMCRQVDSSELPHSSSAGTNTSVLCTSKQSRIGHVVQCRYLQNGSRYPCRAWLLAYCIVVRFEFLTFRALSMFTRALRREELEINWIVLAQYGLHVNGIYCRASSYG